MSVNGRPKPPPDYDDNPELTSEDIAAMRPGAPWMWAGQDRERAALRAFLERLARTAPDDRAAIEALQRDLRARFPELAKP